MVKISGEYCILNCYPTRRSTALLDRLLKRSSIWTTYSATMAIRYRSYSIPSGLYEYLLCFHAIFVCFSCSSKRKRGTAGQASFMLLGVMSCTVIMSGLSRASSMHGDQLSKLGLWPHCGAVLCGWRLHRILYKSCFSYGTE